MIVWASQIKRYRRLKGLTQTTLANCLGVTQATVSRWERGLQDPDISIQHRLRDELRTGNPAQDRHLLHLVRCSPTMMVLMDQDLTLVAASSAAAAASEMSAPEMEGMCYAPMMTADLQEVFSHASDAGFFEGEVASIFLPAMTPGLRRQELHLIANIHYAALADGTPLALVNGRFVSSDECSAARRQHGVVITRLADLGSC